ncbi:MAG: Hg(II)-responsive transcriptional regulator [gamma proteobacterium symbiont of Bathyaustriella thionipta]|nr:Hg(II)-responsive transcriptional regulator [gamma proteobacterium symbiont of Bathyaustriella thionipta]
MTRSIGKLAKELSINIETIRFYERKGIIRQPEKPLSGYRHYSDEILHRIRFIKRSQDLGFTLDEITDLLSLEHQPCDKTQQLAEKKLNQVQEKIADLMRLEQALKSLLDQCQDNSDNFSCPIIKALQGNIP